MFHLCSRPLLRLCIAAVITISSFATALANTDADKQLLIINSYNEAGPWSKDMIMPFTVKIANVPGVTAELVNLNGTMIYDQDDLDSVRHGLFARYQHNHPEYVAIIGNLGCVLLPEIKEQWGDVPIILITKRLDYGDDEYYFTHETDGVYEHEKHDLMQAQGEYNLTAIHVPDLYAETIELMMRLNPQMRKFVFLADSIYLNRILNADIRAYMSEHYPHIEYEWVVGNEQNGNKFHEYILDENPTVGLLISTWFYGRRSVHGYPILIAGEFYMLPSTKKPVFSVRDSYLEYGAIGGVYPDPAGVRQHIESMLEQILETGDARSIPFYIPDKKLTVIDYDQLMESGIDHGLLPSDAIVINMPPTLWSKYKWQIVICCIVVLVVLGVVLFSYWLQRSKMTWLRSFHRLVANMPIPYAEVEIVYDDHSAVKDVKYRISNAAFRQVREANSTADQEYRLLPVGFFKRHVETLLSTREPVSFIYHFPETDSYVQFLICLVDKSPVARIGGGRDETLDMFAIDISQRIHSENLLKETASKLDLTLNAARIIPWQWDLRKHEINCEAHRVFKNLNIHARFVPEDNTYIIDEDDYLSGVHPEDMDKLLRVKEELLNCEAMQKKVEFRMVYDRKGRQYTEWFEVNIAVGKVSESGSVISLIGSLLIITERKRQERALIEARESAMRSDRLKSAFLSNMSHEIRTPLNAIVGFSNLLIRTEDVSKKERFANIINVNNKLLLQLINDVLDLAKIESDTLDFSYQPTDINALMDDLYETVSMRVQSDVVFNVVPTMSECVINTDPNRLSQVLINLLTNASKFTSHGSITVSYQLEGDMLLFEVKDTGIGLNADEQRLLFRRFSKLNNLEQGNGLGLSISKGIVEKFGGEIGVTSRGRGRGSTFWFTIPYAPCSISEQVDRITEPERRQLEQRYTILVADDNESNYLLMESILEDEFNVAHARNGREAVDMTRSLRPTLVLMDIMMPEMDGYQAAEEIRKFDKVVPILAVTAYAQSTDRKRVMDTCDFDGYMPKPIEPLSLINNIHSLISKNFLIV